MRKAAAYNSEERKITATGSYNIDQSLAEAGLIQPPEEEIYEEDFEEDNYSDDFDDVEVEEESIDGGSGSTFD